MLGQPLNNCIYDLHGSPNSENKSDLKIGKIEKGLLQRNTRIIYNSAHRKLQNKQQVSRKHSLHVLDEVAVYK